MNREFVMKMMQAKKLEYEALKELVPEKMVDQFDKIEKEVLNIVKECVVSGYYESKKSKADETDKQKVHKVVIG